MSAGYCAAVIMHVSDSYLSMLPLTPCFLPLQYPVAAGGCASQHSWGHTGQRLEARPVSSLKAVSYKLSVAVLPEAADLL
jgi:hypothetical protein